MPFSLLICRIQFTKQCTDVRFQQTCSQHNKKQSDKERFRQWKRHTKMSQCNDAAPVKDGFAQSEKIIGEPATWQGKQVNKHGVQSINRPTGLLIQLHSALFNDSQHE